MDFKSQTFICLCLQIAQPCRDFVCDLRLDAVLMVRMTMATLKLMADLGNESQSKWDATEAQSVFCCIKLSATCATTNQRGLVMKKIKVVHSSFSGVRK